MARYNPDWDELGRSIQEIVDRAVNSHDYEKLSRTVRQTVDRAVDMSADAVRKVRANTARVVQEPVKKNLPVLYAKTSGKVVGGVLKTVGGGVLTIGSSVTLLVLTVMQAVTQGVAMLWGSIPLLGLGAGSLLLGGGIRTLTRMNRFKSYRNTLGQKTHCTLEKLAGSVGKSPKFVRKELKAMIDEGLFLEGHLDKEERNLITSHETYRYYEQSRLQLEQRRQAMQQEQDRKAGMDPALQEVLDKGEAFLNQIRKCNDDIPGVEISEKISRIERIVQRIF